MRKYQIISADGHVESHPELWSSRIASKYRDRAPQYGRTETGQEAWILGSIAKPLSVDTATGGRPYDQMVAKNITYKRADGSYGPGLGDGTQRLREQDQDGIDAEVLFPPVFGPNFLKNILTEQGDQEAYVAVIQGYNTWLGEDFCSVAPDRLIGTAILPETGVDDAIAEMQRCAKMGLRAICLNKWPNGTNDSSPDDDRFWAESLELGMKMSPHQNFGKTQTTPVPESVAFELGSMGSRSRVFGRPTRTCGELIATGVLDRFPSLRFYYGESDAGWIPYHVMSTDDWYLRWYHENGVRLPKLPSDYWRDHFRFSFLNDPVAVDLRYQIGVDLLMWASDLPHSTGSFPYSREVIASQFHDVPADEQRQILVENACEYFDLDIDRELTPTP
jgi:predicted TIM-barrel fold metal-dependent hydrolase